MLHVSLYTQGPCPLSKNADTGNTVSMGINDKDWLACFRPSYSPNFIVPVSKNYVGKVFKSSLIWQLHGSASWDQLFCRKGSSAVRGKTILDHTKIIKYYRNIQDSHKIKNMSHNMLRIFPLHAPLQWITTMQERFKVGYATCSAFKISATNEYPRGMLWGYSSPTVLPCCVRSSPYQWPGDGLNPLSN